MKFPIFTLCALACFVGSAMAQPATYASRLYSTELQGSAVKATQFLFYEGGGFAKCHSLLAFAAALNAKEQTTVTGCGITLPAPDGSAPRPIPSPEDFYIAYEDPALRGQVTKAVTVYHLERSQIAEPEMCQQLIAAFHSKQANVRCSVPGSK